MRRSEMTNIIAKSEKQEQFAKEMLEKALSDMTSILEEAKKRVENNTMPALYADVAQQAYDALMTKIDGNYDASIIIEWGKGSLNNTTQIGARMKKMIIDRYTELNN